MKAVGELFVKWNANSFLQLCLRLRFRQQNGYVIFNLNNFGTYIYQVGPHHYLVWFGYITLRSFTRPDINSTLISTYIYPYM